MPPLWDQLIHPSPEEGELWELFHENSKIGRYTEPVAEELVRSQMETLWQVIPMEHLERIPLPGAGARTVPTLGLDEAILRRATPDNLLPVPVPLATLSSLLFHAAGVVEGRGQAGRPFRVTPSGGALYPVELFLHARTVEGLAPGLYHYDALAGALNRLPGGDRTAELASCLVQPALVADTSIQILSVGIFERSTFKYGNRGYRFALLEAGHQAQNLSLVATALGLACVHVGGYRDREVDRLLGLDGLQRSALYVTCIGAPEAPSL
ncbi:MAG TPA: SagB/ThcOx family dehydrogenase [Thermoanaerobaculia bacterium]